MHTCILIPFPRRAQLGTLLYGKRESDDSFISPVYNKEYVGETLLEASMDAVEQHAEDTGREVCTFMNPVRFRHFFGLFLQVRNCSRVKLAYGRLFSNRLACSMREACCSR